MLIERGTERLRVLPALVAILNSFVLDYFARQKVAGIHLKPHILRQLPVPPPTLLAGRAPWDSNGTIFDWLRPRLLELSYTSYRLASLARDLGHDGPPFKWNLARRALVRLELDAAIFHLYGIERDDVSYIMDTFPIVRRSDERKHREYRTKRIILEVYDALARSVATREPYQTLLDPPPGDPKAAHTEGS
jgi:hypothetical protein